MLQAENKVSMGKAVCGEKPVCGSSEELQKVRRMQNQACKGLWPLDFILEAHRSPTQSPQAAGSIDERGRIGNTNSF